VLHRRGLLDGDRLVCAVHGNAYSLRTGECLTSSGPDHPGCLRIAVGWRDGEQAVLRLAVRDGVRKTTAIEASKSC
jgi:nitrite reductase/ring-hydroxylating ferredoxin subunit